MVGLLYALPNTQLTRRLASEGRLNEELLFDPAAGMDQCTQGLNFDTLRPRRNILSDYKRVLEKVYDPVIYARRLQRLAKLLGPSNPNRQVRANDSRSKFGGLEVVASDCVKAAWCTRCFHKNDHSVFVIKPAMGADYRPVDSFFICTLVRSRAMLSVKLSGSSTGRRILQLNSPKRTA